MAYVVCEPCRDCKFTDCVVVCPCECFYQDDRMLYIAPEHCIDCDCCRSECPVDAIFPDTQVPSRWKSFIALNAQRSAALSAAGASPLTEKQAPMPGAS